MFSQMLSYMIDPLVFLLGFGYGLGQAVQTMGGLPYMVFVLPGMACSAMLYTAFLEATYSALARMSLQKSYEAMVVTAITTREIVAAEVLWAAFKGTLSAVAVFVSGCFMVHMAGGVLGIVAAIMVIVLGGIALASLGLLLTSHAHSYDDLNYMWPFFISPMFLFSGVFYDTHSFPQAFQWVIHLLPLAHVVALARAFATGVHVPALELVGHVGYLVVFTLVFAGLSYRQVYRRIFV